jgi:hypothetical protein
VKLIKELRKVYTVVIAKNILKIVQYKDFFNKKCSDMAARKILYLFSVCHWCNENGGEKIVQFESLPIVYHSPNCYYYSHGNEWAVPIIQGCPSFAQ